MKPRAVVISGRSGSGKTALGARLQEKWEAEQIKSEDLLLAALPRTKIERKALEQAARRLDKRTNGKWLEEEINKRLMNNAALTKISIDAVISPQQIHALRYSGWVVTHIHLDASDNEIEKRSKVPRESGVQSWDLSKREIDELRKVADVVIDTDRCSSDDVFSRVFARVEERPLLCEPLVDIIIGGQYGSEGKGNIAHYLAPEYDVLVRVGGPNAGHKVYRHGNDPYTFRQLPSGAISNRDAVLVIGAGAVISLPILLREIADLSVPFNQLVIDPQAMIIDKEDIEWEEEHLKEAIGSTAQGIGSATARKILWRLPNTKIRLAKNVDELRRYLRDSVDYFAECVLKGRRIMLEGTQGTSLSIHHGHYPHVTSRATTASGCLAEAGISGRQVRRVIMVCRTYPIRVGDTASGNTSGFMSKIISFKDISERSGINFDELDKLERGSVSGRPRRVAEFDWAQLRRSLLLNGPTDIALTFADYLGITNRAAFRYEQLNDETLRFIEEVEKVCGIPVSLISTDFRDRNVIDRRMW